jgi:two-component system, NarL family, invasion response regulator UvrY
MVGFAASRLKPLKDDTMHSNTQAHFGTAQIGGHPPLSNGSAPSTNAKASESRIRVLVCDDHPVIGPGLKETLKSYPVDVVGEVSESADIVAAYLQHEPDVVLLDFRYAPGTQTGFDVAVDLQKVAPNVRIVFYSQYDDDQTIQDAYRLRCSAFVTKATAIRTLVDAIKRAHEGKPYFLPDIAERLALIGLKGDDSPRSKLDARDFEIFKDLALGLTQEEIATKMGLGLKTVNIASRTIKEKLGVERTAGLTLLAVKHMAIALE